MHVNSSASSELTDQLPCTSTHQGSPKALVPVLLARHTRRNLRARISYLAMYCLWVCLSVQTQESRFKNKPQATLPRHKRLSREPTPSPRRKRPAKLSLNTWSFFPLCWFCPSNLFSLLCLMGCLRVKGEPQASRLAGSYFLRPHAPPGLVEP